MILFLFVGSKNFLQEQKAKNRDWGKEREASRGEMQVGKGRKLNEGEYDHRHKIFQRNCFYEVQCYM